MLDQAIVEGRGQVFPKERDVRLRTLADGSHGDG